MPFRPSPGNGTRILVVATVVAMEDRKLRLSIIMIVTSHKACTKCQCETEIHVTVLLQTDGTYAKYALVGETRVSEPSLSMTPCSSAWWRHQELPSPPHPRCSCHTLASQSATPPQTLRTTSTCDQFAPVPLECQEHCLWACSNVLQPTHCCIQQPINADASVFALHGCETRTTCSCASDGKGSSFQRIDRVRVRQGPWLRWPRAGGGAGSWCWWWLSLLGLQ
eukprot:1913270-Rhodomonas_salina.1